MHEVVRRKVKWALIDAWRVLASALSTETSGCCTMGLPEEIARAGLLMEGGTEGVRGLEMGVHEMLLPGPSEVDSF